MAWYFEYQAILLNLCFCGLELTMDIPNKNGLKIFVIKAGILLS
jgi:hypothetical protein